MLRHLALVLTLLAAAGGTAFAAPPEGVNFRGRTQTESAVR